MMNSELEGNLKNQYLAAFVVTIISICYGIICGWASPIIYLLTSNNSPLPSGRITMESASWIASLLAIGCFCGNVICGYLAKFGRKSSLLFLSVPMIVSWVLVLIGQNIYFFYAARLLHGFISGGVVVLAPVYLLEIANDSIRGALSSTVILSSNVGILIAFILGAYCDFHITPIITMALTILFTSMFFWFPESPKFLLSRNELSKAEKSTRFYQNIRGRIEDCKLLQFEMDKLKHSLSDTKSDESNENTITWSDLMKNPGRKAMTIGIALAALNQLSGCFAMVSYTATIFEAAGSAMDPNTSAIVIGVIQLLGSFASIYLIERAGRKFLYVLSTIGAAFGFITLGSYMMFKEWNYDVDALNWIPIVSFSTIIFLATLGISTLPYVVIGEVLPQNVKEFGVSFCMALLSSCSFIILKFLPLLIDSLGLHGSMFLFSSVCLSGATFIILYVPETKGKSYDEIMSTLSPPNKQIKSKF